jgi:DNA (cytosine-5)-methyltransferase 1
MQPGQIVDLFAGAGGWDEGLRGLGYTSIGIDVDRRACATARAAGHQRIEADIAALDPQTFAPTWGLLGSPPCQAYTNSGRGHGRMLDKPHVIACAHELAAGHDSRAEHLAACRDPRSLLTVEPLRWALALRPRWLALEQVPGVLELWSLFAGLLCAHGYEATAGVLSSEQFGLRRFESAHISLPRSTAPSSCRRRPIAPTTPVAPTRSERPSATCCPG